VAGSGKHATDKAADAASAGDGNSFVWEHPAVPFIVCRFNSRIRFDSATSTLMAG
jgi:hypothetical protein